MLLNDALNQIIDDGIEAARSDYSQPKDKLKLDGSVAGFEACRGKPPATIQGLIVEFNDDATCKLMERAPDYWYWRCRAAEVEWVANVLSNIMAAQGWEPIAMMTAGGAMKAAKIIGVKTQSELANDGDQQ